jgi:hypothetical protein
MKGQTLLVSLVVFGSGMAAAELVEPKQKQAFATESLTEALNAKGYTLDPSSVKFRGDDVQKLRDWMTKKMTLGGPALELDQVAFSATDKSGKLMAGRVYLSTIAAKGCKNDCKGIQRLPTTKEIHSLKSGERVYMRLTDLGNPREASDLNFQFKDAGPTPMSRVTGGSAPTDAASGAR